MTAELREAIARAKAAWERRGGDEWARKWRKPRPAQLRLATDPKAVQS